MKLSVRVWGMDSQGKLFSRPGVTGDITAIGACVEGDFGLLHRGAIVGVECNNRRARFRVAWAREGRIGIRCVEPGRYIWGVPLKRRMEEIPGDQKAMPLRGPGEPPATSAEIFRRTVR